MRKGTPPASLGSTCSTCSTCSNDHNSKQRDHFSARRQQPRMVQHRSHQATVVSVLAVAVLCLVGGIKTTTTVGDGTGTRPYFDFSTLSNAVFRGGGTASSGTRQQQQEYEINGVVVSVGHRGPAAQRAVTHGLNQRRTGTPLNLLDVIGTSTCNGGGGDTAAAARTAGNVTLPGYDEARRIGLPGAVLLGVQKCGTTALYEFLDQHRDVATTTKELHFLSEKVDDMLIKAHRGRTKQRDGTNGTTTTRGGGAGAAVDGVGIPQAEVRQLYHQVMRRAMKNPLRDAGKLMLDLTPNYIFNSDRMPARISCILPWAKLMVLLRNPVERTRSQFDMKMRMSSSNGTNPYGRRNPTFAEYIQNDLDALQEAGVIQDWSVVDFDAFFESDAMKEAWRTYVNGGLNAPIGMGLYAIQIRPFLDLPNEFLAIRSEDLKSNPKGTFSRVLDFLGLPPLKTGTASMWGTEEPVEFSKTINGAAAKTGIDESTEALLRDVFEPFNRKLAEMLGKEWEGVWDHEPVTKTNSKDATGPFFRSPDTPRMPRIVGWRSRRRKRWTVNH